MLRLTLVRHGRPAIDPNVPAAHWDLAADAVAEVRAIGPVGAPGARWVSSPEPKALATARLLAPGPVEVTADLREAGRTAVWMEEPAQFHALVRRSFDCPDEPALPGWEPVARTRDRVVTAVRGLLEVRRPTVLVGHGTAWTVLVAALTGAEPDLDAWAEMGMPSVAELEVHPTGTATLARAWRG